MDGTRTMKETTVAWKDLMPGMLKLLAKVHQILLCLAFSRDQELKTRQAWMF